MAHMQLMVEKQTKKKSPIADIVSASLDIESSRSTNPTRTSTV